ncbi:MAG: aminotransferase class I/II-fold pyridoxal phosphate-dependent enzyme [Lachnospirales bacterium]
MSAEIYEKLRKLMEKNAYPMHMPGHKRNKNILPDEIYQWDITETGDVDNLHHPTGIIKKAQEDMAKAIGADKSYFLVNGGSSGVCAAIMSVVGENDNIIVASNCHKSVDNGLIMSGARPLYVHPQVDDEGICGGIIPSDLFRLFSDNDAKAVILTSPTYEGFCSDIRVLADIVHKNNAILIVDESHGAHFPFSDKFPKTALSQGADIVINSWHKTLPCPNQAAVLSIKGERVDINRLTQSIHIMTTTSPSYPLMASLDYMRDLLVRDKNLMTVYTKTLWEARHLLSHCKSLKLMSDSFKGQYGIDDIDIGKFTIMVRTDMTGKDLANILLEKYNIQIELAGPHHIIAMTSVADTPKAIIKFAKAICDIDKKCSRQFIEAVPYTFKNTNLANITPRQVFYLPKKEVALKEAVGKIAGESIIAYPPGIPVVAIGQVIKEEHIKLINSLKIKDIEIIGADNDMVTVVEE